MLYNTVKQANGMFRMLNLFLARTNFIYVSGSDPEGEMGLDLPVPVKTSH